MGLNDVCQAEGIDSGKVYGLMKRHEMSMEEAVQEVIWMTDLPSNSE
jgi:hypothetical protein